MFGKTPYRPEPELLSVSDRLLLMAGGLIEGLGVLLAFAAVSFVILVLWAARF
jgi:hypothetical protein